MGFSMSGSTTSIHRSLTKSVPEFASLGWDPYMKRWNFAYERERTLLLPLIIMLDTCKSVFSRTTSQAHVSVPSLCFWEQSLVYQDFFHHSFGNHNICFLEYFIFLSLPILLRLHLYVNLQQKGLLRWLSGKEFACQGRRFRRVDSIPGSGKIPWRRKWQPTPVFLPRESHGQRSLVDYPVHGVTESLT